jgi:eukaryotic-like serine/threonine-protein kinase
VSGPPAPAADSGRPSRERIEEVFEAALEVASADRRSLLDRHCGDDARLRAEVEALLAGHEREDGILAMPAAAAAAALLPDRDRGRQIGPYRVLRELGRGGMGVVYLAERNDGQFRRRVAVKLLRGSPDADELHRRFLAERQILASLSHPNIAQLLDAGVADGQLPYLAIEYVDGQPITEYCDRQRLGTTERLRLFLRMCAAVHHAHQNLVLHRDLKPGNVLVTAAGEVKLLDFGIAKLLNPSMAAADQPVTRTAFRVMTPAYASPEQVRGDPLATTSDVYSLGLILYELLTGMQAHEIRSDSPREMFEVICEREPARPSERVSLATGGRGSLAGEPSLIALAAARDSTPERLRRVLAADLDAIVMMALRKESSRRYGSAELLAADIARYLDGMPVLAHRGSRGYRAGKFLKRHRVPVLAATTAAVALVLGATAAVWQATVAGREHLRAERALAESREVTAFLLGLFEESDPAAPAGAATTAQELLSRGAARAENLSAYPDVQSRVLAVLAQVHLSIGNTEEARRFGERMLSLREAQHGRTHPEVAPALVLLGEVYRRRAEYDTAAMLLERALAVQSGVPAAAAAERGSTLHALATLELARGGLARAGRYAQDAYDIRQRALGGSDTLTVQSLALVASVLRERGEMAEAAGTLRSAVRLRQQGGANAPVSELMQLANLLASEQSGRTEAEEIYRRVLGAVRSAERPDHQRLVGALNGLARLLEARGAIDEAEALLREVVDLRTDAYGSEHRSVSAALAHLGKLLRDANRLDAAEAIYQRMAAVDRSTIGVRHPNYAGTLVVLAVVQMERGRYAEADSLLGEALSLREVTLGADHVLVGRALRRQAQLRIRQRRFASADSLLQRALTISVAQRTPAAAEVRETHELLTELYDLWERPAEAERYRQLALAANAGNP